MDGVLFYGLHRPLPVTGGRGLIGDAVGYRLVNRAHQGFLAKTVTPARMNHERRLGRREHAFGRCALTVMALSCFR